MQKDKSPLVDNRLSLKAIGLWAKFTRALNKRQFSLSEMVDELQEGRQHVCNALEELVERGYCLQHSERRLPDLSQFFKASYIFLPFCLEGEVLETVKRHILLCPFDPCPHSVEAILEIFITGNWQDGR